MFYFYPESLFQHIPSTKGQYILLVPTYIQAKNASVKLETTNKQLPYLHKQNPFPKTGSYLKQLSKLLLFPLN